MKMHFNKKLKYNYYKKYKDIKEIIEKRYNILIVLITLVITVLFVNLFYIQVIECKQYQEKLVELTQNMVTGNTAPRGRIYDRNYKLIVDNEPNKVILYKKPTNVSISKELESAYIVADLIEVPTNKLTDYMIRTFWVKNHSSEANQRITESEWKQVEERKLTSADIENLKLERVTEEELSILTDRDREAAYIYYLMNNGYSYAEKIIKNKDVTDEEYALIASSIKTLDGFDTRLDWNRTYIYGDTLKTILGSVSSSETGIPADLKDYYLEKGYSLNDRVGTSYIEYMYDDYLKGTKDVYVVKSGGDRTLLSEGHRGNDIVLTIDITLQQAIEDILKEELLKTKNEANTEYYNRSFVVVADPTTGEILAMAGKQIVESNGEYSFLDYTPGIITSPVTVGSVVKGASHIVGYNTGALTIGEQRYDTCVKLAGAPEKCSWKPLGLLDDITALKQSSNTYQFYTAMKVGGLLYTYNTPFKVANDAFDIYRNTFAEFGLGVKTGIDLPNEIAGYKGTKNEGGLLLDFAIGQYDNYTPIQLSQYIGTIANNGTRLQPYLLKEVYSSEDEKLTNLLYQAEPIILNQVDTKSEYLDRVKLGFQAVLSYGGTGSGYIDRKYSPAGKTGTSQSFLDTDGDGKIDKETVTNTFVGYAPYDNPRVTFTVVSPDIYHYDNNSTYQTSVNKRIATRVSEKYFELYP